MEDAHKGAQGCCFPLGNHTIGTWRVTDFRSCWWLLGKPVCRQTVGWEHKTINILSEWPHRFSSCVRFAFWQVLLPLFLAILFLHLYFIIYIWWTRIIQARLPCKFGLVTHHVIIQLAMKLIMLLKVNLKTFLISILSLSVTNHGKYSTWMNVENHKAFMTASRRTIYSLQEICLKASYKNLPDLRVHSAILILWKYLYSCSFSAVPANLLFFTILLKYYFLLYLFIVHIFNESSSYELFWSKSFLWYFSHNIRISFL